MKKIELICIGEQKFSALLELEREFEKRIRYFTDFKIIKIKDPKWRDEDINRKKEGELMASCLNRKGLIIACDEKGKKMDSKKFSTFLIGKLEVVPKIVFLIGGHLGLSGELSGLINHRLSFSSMTFPNDLFRIIFLEQLYRAFTIHKNIKYHR